MKPPMHDPVIWMPEKIVKTVYTVQSGDSLGRIAGIYNTTTQAIMDENGLTSTTISIGQKLTIPGTEHVEKDDQGFATRDSIQVIGRVTNESQMIIDDRGENVQATHTIILPNTVKPSLGDLIQADTQTVKVLKVNARKSYSGKKIYYWVTNCGT